MPLPVDRTDITPGTTGSYQDVDVTSYVGSDAGSLAGVILHIVNISGTGYSYDIRENGSTDDNYHDFGIEAASGSHTWVFVGVDSNDIFEAKVENSNIEIYIVGYVTSAEGSSFTNMVDITPSGTSNTWVDIDISSDTGGDTSTMAMMRILNVSASSDNYGIRENGSTDDLNDDLASQSNLGAFMAVDGNEIMEGYIPFGAVTDEWYLCGYLIDNFTSLTNATEYSSDDRTSYEFVDMSDDIPEGNTGACLVTGNSLGYRSAIRPAHKTWDNYLDSEVNEWQYLWTEISSGAGIEHKIQSSGTLLYLWGYTTHTSSHPSSFDDSSWTGYDTIVSQNAKVDEGIKDVYVDLSNMSATWWSNVASDGADVRVTNSDGTTAYSFELESFDSVNKTGALFFNSQGLQTGSDTTYRVYAGNGSATAPATTDWLGRNNVWSAEGWSAVWHLQEDSGSAVDSTGNGNAGTFNGNLPTQLAGKIGDSQNLDGTGDYISVGDATIGDPTGDFTIMGWVLPDVIDVGNENWEVFSKHSGGSGARTGYFIEYSKGLDAWNAGYGDNNAAGFIDVDNGTSPTEDAWYHLALSYDDSVPSVEFSVQGSTAGTNSSGSNYAGNATDLGLGYGIGYSTGDGDGQLDEMRIKYGTKLSSNAISTHHNNQNVNATFWSFDGWTALGGGTVVQDIIGMGIIPFER